MNPIQEYFYRIEEPERSTLFFYAKKFLSQILKILLKL